MSKPSSSKSTFLGFLHHYHSKPMSPPESPTSSTPISQFLSHNPKSNPWMPSSRIPCLSTSSVWKVLLIASQKLSMETELNRSFIGFKYISTGTSNLVDKLDVNLLKIKIKEPGMTVKNAFSRYKQAVGLQMEEFWRRNSLVLLGAGGVLVCILLWRIMFWIANTFIGISEAMANYGFLALSSAIVAFAYNMKLLSVDIPMATGPDQRLFLIVDEEEYRVSGGLISEDPAVKPMAAAKEFEAHEDTEEAKRELEEAERKHRGDCHPYPLMGPKIMKIYRC